MVDLWGGYADKECGRLWNKDTMTVSFSSTKVGIGRDKYNLLELTIRPETSEITATGSVSMSLGSDFSVRRLAGRSWPSGLRRIRD